MHFTGFDCLNLDRLGPPHPVLPQSKALCALESLLVPLLGGWGTGWAWGRWVEVPALPDSEQSLVLDCAGLDPPFHSSVP